MKHSLFNSIEDCPIIPAIKDDEGLKRVTSIESKVIFVLYGDLLSIVDIVKQLHEAGKIVIIHIDLIVGLSTKEIVVDYIKKINADGIITTKPALIRRAKEVGLFAILRFFVFDSMAFQNVVKQSNVVKPDLIEILPGITPKVVKKIKQTINTPVICGGLIEDKDDVMDALKAGAVAVSTSNTTIWNI